MLQAYRDGKDLYVEIASISFHRAYKLCLEHFPKGCPIKEVNGKWVYAKLKTGEDDDILTFEDIQRYSSEDFDPELYDYDKLADGDKDTFKEGKNFRGQAKRILLGIMYGRGEKSIAEQLGCKVDEAKEIKNNVYEAFPKIKVFEDWSKTQVQQYGFVTTLYGRKRRLPDYNMPRYVIYYIDGEGNKIENMDIPQGTKDRIAEKLNKMYRKDKEEYITKLQEKDNIKVIDNGGKISAAGRQIINSQIQGSAADMSKLALVKIYQDEELTKRGVKLIIPVHDEILVETPLRHARYVEKRFAEDMMTAGKPQLTIPVKCDVVNSDRWTGKELDLEKELEGVDETV